MLPGTLTLRAERGHRSLPVGVEAVPPPFLCITYLIVDVYYQKSMLLKNICISTAYTYMSENISTPSYLF